MWACARRWRTAGSCSRWRVDGCSFASWRSCERLRRILREKTNVHMGPRSCCTMPIAMPQPAPGAPTRFAAGTRTSSKKTSQDLAASGVVRHLAQWLYADAGTLHVDEEQADALVLRQVGLGTAEEEAPVGDVGVAR